MPRGDKSGPVGAGPMTGRGAGFCTGYDVSGFTNAAPGRFFGRGGGRRWGYRLLGIGMGAYMRGAWPFRPFATTTQNPADEMDQLKQELDFLEKTIGEMKGRMEELKSGN